MTYDEQIEAMNSLAKVLHENDRFIFNYPEYNKNQIEQCLGKFDVIDTKILEYDEGTITELKVMKFHDYEFPVGIVHCYNSWTEWVDEEMKMFCKVVKSETYNLV